MLQGKMKGGSTAEQKGLCAEMRTYLKNDLDLYEELSLILHSGDKNPNKYGANKYADHTNTYDDGAESVIGYAKGQLGITGRKRKDDTPPPLVLHPSAKRLSPEMGAKHAVASKTALKGDAPVFVPKEFVKGKGLATMPSGSRIYPLTLGQVAKLARGIV
jgi:hypothetical protein